MNKHSIYNPHKFMSSGHHGLSIRQSFFFSSEEISPEEIINSYDTNSHKVNNTPEMSISSFGDSTFAFEFARLINSWINTSICYKIFMGRKEIDVGYFSKESSPCSCINAINRCNDLKVFNHHRFTVREEYLCSLIQSFHEVQECRNFPFKDALFSETYRAYRGFSGINNVIYRDGDFSAFFGGFKGVSDDFGVRKLNNPCRREFFEEVEDSMCKDITDRLQFWEDRLKDSFDFIFSRCDEVRDEFSFSGNVSEVSYLLGDREFGDGVFVDEEKVGNSKGIFFIGLSLSEGEFSEVGDKKRVYEDILRPSGAGHG